LDTPAQQLVIGAAVALGGGLLIGLDRERRKGEGPERQPAGIRTFTLAALAGALAQGLGEPALVALGALVVVLLSAAAYFRSRSLDPGLTTELALFVTYLIGVLSMAAPALGAGTAALVAGLLAARGRLHRFATEVISEGELHDALLLAALALVVVPLIPQRPLDWLGGLQPRSLALIALLILLVQAVGHIALRVLGSRAGLLIAGFFSGFVSSTATIASMGARRRADPAVAADCASGAILSTAATWVQALVMLLPLAPQAVRVVLPAAAAGVGVALATALLRVRRGAQAGATTRRDPAARVLRVREAAAVALLLALVAVGVSWAQRQFGDRGLLLGIALAGLADAQSGIATLGALARAGTIAVDTAATGVLVGITSNSVVRAAVAFAAGGRRFGMRVAGSLVLSTGAAWLGMMAWR
jgi:uncharacterized membrane protein (DUF4010 family)